MPQTIQPLDLDALSRIREETYAETKAILKEHGRCAVIRPTGFGKTGMAARFILDGPNLAGETGKAYNKILFLYPLNAVRSTLERILGESGTKLQAKVLYRSYMSLIREKDRSAYGGVDLVILDEAHKAGARATSQALEKVLSLCPGAHVAGMTATPERMDLVNVVNKYFGGHTTSPYTLHDAISGNICYRPWYVFCSHTQEDVWKASSEAKKQILCTTPETRPALEETLRAREIQIADLSRMDRIIEKTCSQYAKDPDSMRFFVFFANFAHMDENAADVASWFMDAYPSLDVTTTEVSSRNKETRENAEFLSTPLMPHTIQLIYTVDMLNLGYHTDDITGSVFYRGTNSGNIFIQQLGRNFNSKWPAIIFDVVDNLHRQSLYQVLGERSTATKKRKALLDALEAKAASGKPLAEGEELELKALRKNFNQPHWYTGVNELTPDCFVCTGHEAAYRELIAKTVAEPMDMACHQAFARWVEKGGDPGDYSREWILSQKEPEAVPLLPFCKSRKQRIQDVLDVVLRDREKGKGA